ncbi:MAG: hypothetical protein LBI60_02915 [Bacteroidales bacterium]|jgi:hypothetical protein|nr:hypothetical protein [Bacteroidales bacterium]
MFKLLFRYIIRKIRLKRAIKKANKYRLATGKKYYVFRYGKKFIILTKRQTRNLMAKKIIRASIKDIRKIILYETKM